MEGVWHIKRQHRVTGRTCHSGAWRLIASTRWRTNEGCLCRTRRSAAGRAESGGGWRLRHAERPIVRAVEGEKPGAALSRRMALMWYATPQRRRINSAMRRPVQTSVANPKAEAPFRRQAAKARFCRAVNFDGRPGAGRAATAASPPCRCLRSQAQTLCGVAFKRRAISAGPYPWAFRATACRRRFSNCSGLPRGLMLQNIGPQAQ